MARSPLRRIFFALCGALIALSPEPPPAAAGKTGAPVPPPGHNVHLVRSIGGRCLWRGGAPRRDTLQSLAARSRATGRPVTLIDLRHPANADDRTGKGDRLTPTAEEREANRLRMKYVGISALAPDLNTRISEALQSGDVYLHCMYGVNRTGFAVARYAVNTGIRPDRSKLGERDWAQGEAFERRAGRSAKPNVRGRTAPPRH